MSSNYYDILNIPSSATSAEIRKAYRKLALKYHPDKSNDSGNLFRELKNAYDVLKNPEKRQKYDKQIIPERKRKGSDLRVFINVKFEEMLNDCKKYIVIKRKGLCPSCEGTGSEKKKIKKCIYCNETGLQGLSLVLGQKKKCSYCMGEGKIPEGNKCQQCKGTSLIEETKQCEVNLNPFINFVMIPGLGNHSPFQGKAGNLIVDFIRDKDNKYQIDGLNITSNINITPVQAILGDIVHISVFGKDLNIKIPPGIQHGAVIKQQGLTYKKETGFFKIIVKINIPQIITEAERKLYQEILNIEKEIDICQTSILTI